MQQRVIIVNTGGTIAMKLDESTDSVQSGGEQPLHSIEPILDQYAHTEMVDLLNIPSPHMTPKLMVTLADSVRTYLAKDDVLGVVITHGTDTLEETAFFLDLTVSSEKPIVVTGAMRSSNELGADGPINLIQSVRVAAHPDSCGRGVLVVFNDEIHAARDVTKTHTSNVSTFQSPGFGPVGLIMKRGLNYHQTARRGATYSAVRELPDVPLIKMVTGMNPEWLSFLQDDSIKGVVVEAFGAGNVSPDVVPVLEDLISRKIPVVIVSRCYNGFVQDLYGYDGGGKRLRELGAIFCNGLNGQKARLKLMVVLGSGVPFADIPQHF